MLIHQRNRNHIKHKRCLKNPFYVPYPVHGVLSVLLDQRAVWYLIQTETMWGGVLTATRAAALFENLWAEFPNLRWAQMTTVMPLSTRTQSQRDCHLCEVTKEPWPSSNIQMKLQFSSLQNSSVLLILSRIYQLKGMCLGGLFLEHTNVLWITEKYFWQRSKRLQADIQNKGLYFKSKTWRMLILHPIIQHTIKNIFLSENGTICALVIKRKAGLLIKLIKFVQKYVYKHHMV